MVDITHTTTKPHLLAIDIARRFNAVLIELASGEQRRFKMTNSAQDFDRLLHFINATAGVWRTALEPTGDDHRAIAHRLMQAGVEVVIVTSVAQSRFREANFNSWDK